MKWVSLIICVLFFLPMSSLAADKVVVIPLNTAKKLQNIETVSKSGGDFTDPVAAVSSITDASADNPYLVIIGPGVYTLTQSLNMKPYVSIIGSGQRRSGPRNLHKPLSGKPATF